MNKIISLTTFALSLMVVSCERDAEIDIPAGESKIVVEGWIEPGAPPVVLLKKSQPYFGTSNFSDLSQMFVHDATITVSDGVYSATLFEICTSSIPDSLLPLVSSFIGIDTATLQTLDFCAYTTFDTNIYGIIGKNYYLNINSGGTLLSSVTSLPQAVPLDSAWFALNETSDSLGYAWASMKDPDTLGNAYRWYAKRETKDLSFIAPIGSAFEDKFINGTSFDFAYNRGDNDFATTQEPPGEWGYFKKGDTIIVKFCTIDHEHYLFWRTYETQIVNNGNPFAAPAPVNSNITGGLGVWGGFTPSYDTIYAQ